MTKQVPSSIPVVCPFCKQKGHISIKSLKCRYFKPLTTKVAPNKKRNQDPSPLYPRSPSATDDVHQDGKDDNFVDSEVNATKFVPMKVPKSSTSKYVPVVDVDNPTFTPGDTIFQIMSFENCDDESTLTPTPSVFVLRFSPIELINQIVVNSNTYIKTKVSLGKLEYSKSYREKEMCDFTPRCVYQFIAILYYMGMIELPCMY